MREEQTPLFRRKEGEREKQRKSNREGEKNDDVDAKRSSNLQLIVLFRLVAAAVVVASLFCWRM